ncbi:MAG TPA: outer membrane protein assembly factor BamA [Anaeromyxobacteraceae bacterium]|nr:outer membrane protein assembly factor BamA [Anaeromyxobacteraceae bacterium]
MRGSLVPALALGLLLCAPARAAQPPVVGAIEVEGTRRVEAEAVRAAVSSKVGEPVDEKKLDADVRAVMKLGFFADVAVEQRGDEKRPSLVFRVVEKPAVAEVRIEGTEELSKEDFKEMLAEIKPSSILDLVAVKKISKKIQDKYVEKGFYLAEVGWRLDDKPDNQVAVVFTVQEHAKVQVRSVSFLGNEHVPRSEIDPYMQTREGGWLSFILSGGPYKEDAFRRDLEAVQFVYQDKGYVTVKVHKPTVSLSPDKRFLYATIRVEEGERYTIGKIDYAGDLLYPQRRLEELTHSRSGEIFSRSKVGKDLFAIADLYKDDGYAYANVNPLTNLDPKKRIIDLTYEVQPGQKVRFERIEVVGNLKTREKVIRRELRFYEGELYSQTAINVSKARVNALGFFEKVEITTSKGSADDKMVARVEVKERSTGTFQLGAGFSSYENFILTGQISQNNFFGWGTTLSLQVQWSSIRQLGQIQYVDPYFLDTRWTFAFDLYAQEGLYTTFTRRAMGGSLTWGYELVGLEDWWAFARKLEDVRLFATYTNEYIRVTPSGVDVPLANRFRSGTTSALRLSLQVDRRDNRLFPTAGYYGSVSAEVAPPVLAPEGLFGANVNLFTRYTADFRYYKPLWLGLVARFRVSGGLIDAWDAAHPVPISELYYLGGINSIRGYRIFSIAPQERIGCAFDPRTSTCLTPTGGNKQLVANAELELPIADKVGIRAVVFFDAGNAFAPGQWHDPAVPFSLYKSWGFGLRWISPLGPLRFEWGFPLNRRKDVTGVYIDRASDFQFTIGTFF